jgi:hypothetical protein
MSRRPKDRPAPPTKAAANALRFEAEFTTSGKLLLRTVILLAAQPQEPGAEQE